MGYSLGQAAKAAGRSKTTIHRAIKSGRLSAARADDGEALFGSGSEVSGLLHNSAVTGDMTRDDPSHWAPWR